MRRAQFRELLVHEFGEDFCYSYFDPSEFDEGSHPVLRPWSGVAFDKFRREAKRFLFDHDVKLGAPICEHLKPKTPRAA